MKNSSFGNNSQAKRSSKPIKFALIGEVINRTMAKTIKVLVTKKLPHPVYKKTVSQKKAYLVHDERNEAQIGDQVKIVRSRKFSKRKYFYLAKILKAATKVAETSQISESLETQLTTPEATKVAPEITPETKVSSKPEQTTPDSSELKSKTTPEESTTSEESKISEEKTASEEPKTQEEKQPSEEPKASEENKTSEEPKTSEEKETPEEPKTSKSTVSSDESSSSKE